MNNQWPPHNSEKLKFFLINAPGRKFGGKTK